MDRTFQVFSQRACYKFSDPRRRDNILIVVSIAFARKNNWPAEDRCCIMVNSLFGYSFLCQDPATPTSLVYVLQTLMSARKYARRIIFFKPIIIL